MRKPEIPLGTKLKRHVDSVIVGKNAPHAVQACLATLEKLLANALEHPLDTKLRSIRGRGKAIQAVTGASGGEDFMRIVIWMSTLS